nr:PREDICTED: facilitated trehalose transporter Tret1-like [Megachile rotundata]
MNKNDVGISQQTLVSNIETGNVPAKRLPQYIAMLSVILGGIAVGTTVGWTSSAGDGGRKLQDVYQIEISEDQFSWISSLTTLGGGVACLPTGVLTKIIGRKMSMMLTIIPFTIAWLLIIFANSVLMFCIGRFIIGLSAGAFCVAAPMYSAEIAENQIRGALGSYVPLSFSIGILVSYILATFVNIRVMSIICATVPFIFLGIFMFMPESPTYYLQKGDDDSARKSLIKLRGRQYNVENELQEQREALEENAKMAASFFTVLKSKATVKACIISYGLVFFQQLCGINAISFYASGIFERTGVDLDPNVATIIIGVIQILAGLMNTFTVDYLGRKILLIGSAIFMVVGMFALGLYFYLYDHKNDVSSIGWLPLLSICIFIIAFNIGFGPAPWIVLGEVFAPEVRGVAASSAVLLTWFFTFFVTKFFSNLNSAMGTGPTFWFFGAMSAIAVVFVCFVVPETKGKSLIDIQKDLKNS